MPHRVFASYKVPTVGLLIGALLLAMFSIAPPAAAAVGLTVSPDFPTTVSPGQTNIPAALMVVNNSTLIEAIGEVSVSSLRMVPSCSDPADAGCDAPGSIADPGAFTLSPTGTGRAGTGCEGRSFTITVTAPATGEVTFAPANGGPFLLGQPLLSNDQNRCIIDFQFGVNRLPNHDYSGAAPGTQTTQVAIVQGVHQLLGSPGLATGTDLVTVTAPTPSEPAAVGDFNGDGSTDVGVWRPPTGQWFVKDQFTQSWGLTGDIPVPGDYDGSGSSDVAVFRPPSGQWFVAGQATTFWGLSGDVPVPADYDGNGSTDIAVWRPSSGQWFVRDQLTQSWGLADDVPVPADYDGNGSADIAVWRPSSGQWFVLNGSTVSWGLPGDIPVPADYDGDSPADRAVYRDGQWLFQKDGSSIFFGLAGDVPLPLPPALYLRLFDEQG